MATTREIRQKLREEEKARTRRREAAVVAVARAGEAVAAERVAVAERQEKLRERTASVLAAEQAAFEERRATLQRQLEVDLAAEDAKIVPKEVAAGQAVLAAMGGELAAMDAAWREGQLHDLTEISLAELRRWARRARQEDATDVTGQDAGGVIVGEADELVVSSSGGAYGSGRVDGAAGGEVSVAAGTSWPEAGGLADVAGMARRSV